MTLQELRDECRRRTQDTVVSYLWSDEEWNFALNEAEREGATRGRLLIDDEGAEASIDFDAGQQRARLHRNVLDVLSAKKADGTVFTAWDLDESHMHLDEPAQTALSLSLTVLRLPRADMEADDDEPEIRPEHHAALIDWALHVAYLKKDADTFDEQASARHLARFTAYFGPKPTANVLRKHRRKSPRVVRMVPF